MGEDLLEQIPTHRGPRKPATDRFEAMNSGKPMSLKGRDSTLELIQEFTQPAISGRSAPWPSFPRSGRSGSRKSIARPWTPLALIIPISHQTSAKTSLCAALSVRRGTFAIRIFGMPHQRDFAGGNGFPITPCRRSARRLLIQIKRRPALCSVSHGTRWSSSGD